MAFICIHSAHCKALLLISQLFLIWHGGTPVAAQSGPSPVQSFSIKNITTTSVILSWVPPNETNSNNYTYSIKVSNGSTTWDVPTNISGDSVTVTDLIPGVYYTFSIYSNGTSVAESINGTTVPSPVQSVSIKNITTTSVILSWAPPNDINNNTYTYSIKVSNGSTTLDGPTNISGGSVTVTGLIPGVYYTFFIYTETANGTIRSQPESISGTTVPSPVQNVSIKNITTTSVILSWVPPNDTNSNNYTYSIKVFNGSTTWDGPTNISGDSVTVTGLIPGVYYTFFIYTETSNGTSVAESINGTTVPSPVRNVSIKNITTTSVILSWVPPNDTNSNTYTYSIKVSNGSTTWDGPKNISGNSVTVTGLIPGVYYTFFIYTETANGTSQPESISGTTEPSPSKDVTITSRTMTTVNLSWTPPDDLNSNTYSYTIKWSNGSGTWNMSTSENATSAQVKELLPGVTYNFSVYTVTFNGTMSSAFTSDKGTTRPSLVQNVTVKAQTNDSVTLSWIVPNDINKDSYHYIITVGCTGTTCDVTITTNASGTTVLSLLPGLTYKFLVYTVTSDGTNSSDFASTSGTTAPNAPADVNGNPVNTTALSISWTPPNDLNKNNYTYTVYWNEKPGELNQSSTRNTTLVITGLTAGIRYNVSVVSVINNVDSVKAMTDLQTNPEPLGNNIIVSISNSTVTVTWTNPSGGSYDGIEINADDGTRNVTKNFTNLNTSQGTLDGLTPGTAYKLSLRSFSVSATTTKRSGIIGLRAEANTITTFSEPVIRYIQMDPNIVTEIKCSKISGGYKLGVKFLCPTGSFTSINILAVGNQTIPALDCKDNTEWTVTNLQPASQYKIEVVTVANTKQVSASTTCATDNVGVIVGSIFGVLLFLLLVGLLAYFVLKKRRGLQNKFGKDSRSLDKIKIKRVPSVVKTAFPDYYQRQHADSDFGFAEEYQQLSTVGTDQSKRAAELPENRPKNRFTNVLPYDHSRVKLYQIDGDDTSDYINANYMPGYNSSKEFIAAQGPLPNTSADFWRLVWENQVSTIVMLTNCTENGRVKCDHYWPLDYTPCTYGDITVTVTSETILPDWTIRDFSLKNAKQQGNKYARHFHFTVWPDHGVPENTTAIVQFRNLVREYMDQKRSSGPTIVHCSAGVGRTGTLIALDYLIQKMEKEQRIGIYGFVQKMRLNRPLMVQTESQYVFLNKCMLELLQNPAEENIYENQIGGDLIYENASVVRDYQKDKL